MSHIEQLPENIVQIPPELQISPPDLYALFFPSLEGKDEIVYPSGPVTSAGGRRNPNLSTQEVIAVNSEFYIGISIHLALQMQAKHFVVPHTIGQRFVMTENNEPKAWTELDYLTFWLMVITGLAPNQAENYFCHAQTIMQADPVMNNYALSHQERKPAYEKLSLLTLDFINQIDVEYNPLSMIISLPDSQLSLGSTLEQAFSQKLGIPLYEVSIDPQHFMDSVVARLLVEHGVLLTHEGSVENSEPVQLQAIRQWA